MSFDYSKLTGKIIELYKTQYNFSIAIGLSERSLSLKLNNKVRWKDTDIKKACELLSIDDEDVGEYFFKQKVQNIWTKHIGWNIKKEQEVRYEVRVMEDLERVAVALESMEKTIREVKENPFDLNKWD